MKTSGIRIIHKRLQNDSYQNCVFVIGSVLFRRSERDQNGSRDGVGLYLIASIRPRPTLGCMQMICFNRQCAL